MGGPQGAERLALGREFADDLRGSRLSVTARGRAPVATVSWRRGPTRPGVISARESRNTKRRLTAAREPRTAPRRARVRAGWRRGFEAAVATKAAAPVIASSVHWTSGRTLCLVWRRRGRAGVGWRRGRGRRGGRARRRRVEARRPVLRARSPRRRSCLRARGGCSTGSRRRGGDILAQSGTRRRLESTTWSGVIRARREVRNSRISSLVSTRPPSPGRPRLGDPASTPINRDSHFPRSRAFLDVARGRDNTTGDPEGPHSFGSPAYFPSEKKGRVR